MIRELLNENRRMDLPAQIFGVHFPLRLEPFVYDTAGRLSKDYKGGFWLMYELENGGFYMAPNGTSYRVSCPNGFGGNLSGDAFGITVCMYAYSHCSFSAVTGFAERCSEQYHLLRDFMFDHEEVESMLRAID